VLDEHRLAGHAVMPGTGHLASVVAAGHAVLDGGGRLVELRDVALVEPLVVSDDGQAEIRVAFAEGADDADFQVTSRSAGQERTHVRGTLAWVAGDPAPVHDLAAIRARCRSGADQESRTSQSGLFTFGPRWSSLRDVDAGPVEAIALIEAAGPVAAELDQWHPHPALLDEAVSFAATRLTGRCMPLGYGRLLLRSPLPARFWSHLRYRDAGTSEVIVADFTLLADDGTEIASISDFVLRRIDPDALGAELSGSAASAARVPAVTTTDATGIAPADGADALRRVLAHDLGPQVSVTAAGIHASIAGARALTQQTVEENLAGAVSSRPERTLDDGGYVAPTTDLQRVLCHLWQDMLGLDRIGVDDDFFAAGGNSLVAVQLIAGIRAETGVRIPMRLLFEASTVAGMAAEIEQLRAGAAAAGDGEPGEPEITALPRPGR
jgi:acyl carrier protein